ncbi:MAG: septal ring lytic transglycosylase RlpA family protein [Parasphingorhabdus sp.]
MQYAVKLAFISTALLALSACGASKQWGKYDDDIPGPATDLPPAPSGTVSVSDYPQKIGEPYQIGGKTYTPEDVTSYDQVGYASWYGQELAGNSTANGERFNPNGISAAHKTLPLPSYVEVTALDTGRTILVRVNDRGPFSNDRLIDLSFGAAKQLGIDQQGVAGVRVRKVNPNEQERAVLRSGGQIAERIATPDSLLNILRKNLAKLPRPTTPNRQIAGSNTRPAVVNRNVGTAYVPPSGAGAASGTRDGRFVVEGENATPRVLSRPRQSIGNNYVGSVPGSYVVQVAAFSSKSRADTLAKKIGAKVMPDGSRQIWRVRYGPYNNQNAAQAGLVQAKQRGYSGARILRADR